MELKVWMDGVVRVVCGLSLDTPCQDVVIALAQAVGQTGRYVLVSRLRGTERALVADDCPLRHVAQLGQLGTEVHFILRRTGPSLSTGPETPTGVWRFPHNGPPEPEHVKHREPQKALTFNLGPSTFPRRNKPKRDRSLSPRNSPEPLASPGVFLDSLHPVKADPSSSSYKEEVFRQVIQQQRRLQDLELQLQALERETELWEREKASALVPSMVVVSETELEELEQLLRQNQSELDTESWEEQLQEEMDRETDMQRRLHQLHSSLDHHDNQMKELQALSAHLEQDLQLRVHRLTSEVVLQPDQVLRPLKQQLHQRLQQGGDLEASLSETNRELQAAEERVQDRWETMEELNKELRQRKLQEFIQQSGAPHPDHTHIYLSNAGIMEHSL